MKAVIYCRVSTDNQEKEGTSLQTQLQACLDYCKSKDYEVSSQFSETFSGLSIRRPKLDELRDLLRTGNSGKVIVYCLDRLSRDPYHGVILMQEFEKSGVMLEAVTESVDSSELGKLICYIRGFASKLEAEKILERTTRGKQAFLKAGKLPQGTGIGIYGYSWDKSQGRRNILDSEAEVVRRMYQRCIEGASIHHIAVELNREGIPTKGKARWNPLTVRRILTNQCYMGKTYFGQTKRISRTKVQNQPKENWIILPNVSPPIISEDIYNSAQAAMKSAHEHRPIKPNAAFLLTGFARCSKCGSPLGGTTLSGKYRYYQCRGAKATASRAKLCDAGYIRADEIEQFIWERLAHFQSSALALFETRREKEAKRTSNIQPLLEQQIDQVKKKLKTYDSKERNLYDLLVYGNTTKEHVLDAISKLKANFEEDQRQLAHLTETLRDIYRTRKLSVKLSDYSENMKNVWSSGNHHSVEDKRPILAGYGVKVLAVPGSFKLMCFQDVEITTESLELVDSYNVLIKEFEDKHPEHNLWSLIDARQPVPEDTKFGKFFNEYLLRQPDTSKDLVTIARTSA